QHRAREADILRQDLDRPWALRARMHERQCLADKGVAQARQPSGLHRGQVRKISPYDLDEHQLAQLGEHALPPRALLSRFHPRKMNELVEPGRIIPLAVPGFDDAWQVVEERIERLRIAGEESADKLGRDRPVAAVGDGEWQLAADTIKPRYKRVGAHAGTAR